MGDEFKYMGSTIQSNGGEEERAGTVEWAAMSVEDGSKSRRGDWKVGSETCDVWFWDCGTKTKRGHIRTSAWEEQLRAEQFGHEV